MNIEMCMRQQCNGCKVSRKCLEEERKYNEVGKIRNQQTKDGGIQSKKRTYRKRSRIHKNKKSINEFGYVSPIIINSDMTVISGHQRLKVLKDLGNTEIECIIVNFDKSKEKMLSVALNKISGEWDYQKLENLFNELVADNMDLSIMGFDEKEINKLIKETEEIINENTEINIDEFNDEKFQCKCPKCGFVFDIDKQ